jgi:hypothetical protein
MWKRWAVESMEKRTVALSDNDIVTNIFPGGMDLVEGTFVWNYTIRECEEELEVHWESL